MHPFERELVFEETGDARFPYQCMLDETVWAIRLGEFPEESLYILMLDGEVIAECQEWPKAWVRPAPNDEEARIAHFNREEEAWNEMAKSVSPLKLDVPEDDQEG